MKYLVDLLIQHLNHGSGTTTYHKYIGLQILFLYQVHIGIQILIELEVIKKKLIDINQQQKCKING